MEKQKTAVEWLVEQFKEKLTGSDLPGWVLEIINQAKQMEKEQIGLAFIIGYAHGSVDSGLTAKEYYNERYEGKTENND